MCAEANEQNTIFHLSVFFFFSLSHFVWSFNLIMMHILMPTKWLETSELCTQCASASIFIITMFLFSFASNGMLR